MRAIMVMFDSLNRHMLPNYGCDWTHAPNFKRLGEKTVAFDQCYAGSLPCMPARRELHTGRYNFLHRSWGPIEPFDNSMPEMLKQNGVYTHLVTDHQHYWEDGGATYHPRYSSFEMVRGQEGDPWKGHVKAPEIPETETPEPFASSTMFKQDMVNRSYFESEENHPQAVTFSLGMDFIQKNKDEDNWFLQLETFDPHEPFFAFQQYKELYPHEYNGKHFDWPPYYFVQESDEVVQHGKFEYAALLSMCDNYLGKVMDMMDEHDMWKDTMLIVNTDHGYLLGEHGWWSKSVMPVYNEIAHTPLFVWDPREGKKGERRQSIVQTVDLAPTLLEFFGMTLPKDMDGKPLRQVIHSDQPIRETALFGFHGGHVNITDGKYVYMRGPVAPENRPLFEYTLMPTHMRQPFAPGELQNIEIQEPFSFTKGCQLMKIQAGSGFVNPFQYGSKLFNLETNPKQEEEIEDLEIELTFIHKIAEQMRKNDAPKEQFIRLGIPEDGIMTIEDLKRQKEIIQKAEKIAILEEHQWDRAAQNQIRALLNIFPENERQHLLNMFTDFVVESKTPKINTNLVDHFIDLAIPKDRKAQATYFLKLASRTN
ncbi:sulfatase [Metabacillus halosaccharovorans]|uniref:sulfatase n=1 Tax=Metabacillus halosaccharovorans TaxID=930124 RepID=UPI001C1F4A27|nr:sulfatase [Metabacillus halosaccharovorans]MBU7591525.1 sulfatase [Metabacillus halosaccharovorans]